MTTLAIITKKIRRQIYVAFILATGLVFCLASSPLYAMSREDLRSIVTNQAWYDPKDTCGDGTGSLPVGTLPAIIPEPYNGAFTAAGQKHNVSPSLIAAIFTEENFTTVDPTEAALSQAWKLFVEGNYGGKHRPVGDANSGWPTNKFETMGAFQFLPGTWYGKAARDPSAAWDATKPNQFGFGDDGNNDGKRNPQHIADGAAGAAKYVAHNGATIDKPPASWQNAIFNYNHAQWYVDAVMAYYEFYNRGGSGGTANSGGNVTPEPTDPCAGSSVGNTDCNSGTGNILILCQARKFDPFGYLWGGGHGDPAAFMNKFNAAGGFSGPFRQWVDCSGLETVAIWLAFNVKLVFSTASMSSHTQYLKRIDASQAQPGDLMWREGHTEIATEKGGVKTFGAHTDKAPPEKQIGDSSGQKWSAAYVYIGPGSDRQ